MTNLEIVGLVTVTILIVALINFIAAFLCDWDLELSGMLVQLIIIIIFVAITSNLYKDPNKYGFERIQQMEELTDDNQPDA